MDLIIKVTWDIIFWIARRLLACLKILLTPPCSTSMNNYVDGPLYKHFFIVFIRQQVLLEKEANFKQTLKAHKLHWKLRVAPRYVRNQKRSVFTERTFTTAKKILTAQLSRRAKLVLIFTVHVHRTHQWCKYFYHWWMLLWFGWCYGLGVCN